MAWFRKSAISLACLSAMSVISGQTVAAEGDNKKDKKPEMEIIEVRGIKSSLKKALNDKRYSDQVADMISAEDIGKLPDENVADALQRVTGVTINRDSGEGSTISVRGVAPGLSNVTINGQSQASAAGEGREFSFDAIASEHVSALQVIKSPTADMEEGGIGATVNVVTRRALDFKDDKTKVSAFADYSELTEKTEPRLSAMISRQNEDQTFGFLLSANHSVRTLQEDALRGWGWREYSVEEKDGAVEGGEVGDEYSYLNRLRYQTGTKERTRTGGTVSFQWLPSDELELYWDVLYSQLKQIRDETYLETRFPAGNNKTGKKVILDGSDSAVINQNGTLVAAQIDGAQLFNSAWHNEETTKTVTSTLGGDYLLSNTWELSAEVGYSHIERNTDDNIRSFAQGDKPVDLDYHLDGRFPVIDYYKDAKGVIGADHELLNPGDPDFYTTKAPNLRVQLFNIEDTKATVKFDVTGTLDGDLFSAIKFGAMAKHQNKTRIKNEAFIKKFEGHNLSEFPGEQVTGLYEGSDAAVSSLSWRRTDLFKMRETALADGFDLTPEPVPEFNYDVTEDTQAVYVRADYDTDVFGNMPLRGNLGVRYVNTDVESKGASEELDGSIVDRTLDNDYSDVLPSFNLALGLTEDLLLRGAVAKVMSRPSLSDLSAHRSVNDNGDGLIVIRQGNVDLDPYRAIAYDLSLEWYFDEASVLSVAGFYKDVDSFIFDLRHATVDLDGNDVEIIEPTNGAGASVKGAEVAFQHAFDYLPGFLNGFGVNLNYTYQTSDADFNREGVDNSFGMPGLSRDSYNAVVFYEKDAFSSRLAYNYRSKYLIEPSGRQEDVVFGDDYGQLDFSASYDITKQLTVSFNAINLTDAEQRQYAEFEERLYENYIYGRRYHLGLSYSF
ncbi:TonB-dependent receptor [Shewanella corallii]|uniref:TonB-dependent receptor n=1 Tax=Shewanella corallii TaxID=560080 RepID=A0ABT0N5H7_9GAMM|nr:TonB-dependent receptor [Shewanella corallii]MCL2913708.1 TonB-dependent receptor [Shewanella corallii]